MSLKLRNGENLLSSEALNYLASLETRDTTALVKNQFDSADNMTDRMAALSALSLCDVPERQQALAPRAARAGRPGGGIVRR